MQCVRRAAGGSLSPPRLAGRRRASLKFAQQRRHLTIAELDQQRNGRQRVVVLGAGWAGFTISRDLDARKYQIVVVSPRSYFVFTPLLAGTSVGTLEFRTTMEPVRSFKGRKVGADYYQAWADQVDFEKKILTVEEAVEDPLPSRALTPGMHEGNSQKQTADEEKAQVRKGELFDMTYDKLVVGVGCYSQTFNTPGVRENAYFLKDVGDARRIRNRLLSCFEIAALPTTSEEAKRHFLNFAVVGGGPTGIEWSAELYDMVHEDMERLFPELIKHVRITVYDVAPKVLSMFDESLSKYAMKTFNRNGISIKTSHHIEALRKGVPPEGEQATRGIPNGNTLYTLTIKEEGAIPVGMCVWSTGLMMNPFVEHALQGKVQQHPRSHGILTDAHLRVQSPAGTPIPDVYALGDCAVIADTAYPATAQVANQQARWLAKRLNRSGDDVARQPAFTYRDLGVMAYVGNRKAILQSGGGDVSGWVAWLIWRGAYLTKTVSWRNRILIPIYWALNWCFGRDVSRF